MKIRRYILSLLITLAILFGFLTQAFSSTQVLKDNKKDHWPYQEFTYARAYLYNLENRLHGNHAIIKDKKLDKTVVGDGVLLNKTQIKTIIEVINSDIAGLIQGLSKSYIPHQGIVFYDANNQPVAYITICFDCEALRVFPEVDFPKKIEELPEKEIKRLLILLERLKKIIIETNLPVFDSPFEYKKISFLPPAARGTLFEKTVPLDPQQKLLVVFTACQGRFTS